MSKLILHVEFEPDDEVKLLDVEEKVKALGFKSSGDYLARWLKAFGIDEINDTYEEFMNNNSTVQIYVKYLLEI